jgi:tRNA(Ile)-lysidine synthase
MELAPVVAAFVSAQRLARSPGIIACSGGPDSIALARALAALLHEGRLPRLVVAHLDHQLRPDSASDADFVRMQTARWHPAEFRTHTVDIARKAVAARDNLEATARRERYAWLTELAREVGAAWVAVGHTADDQAETILFRLLRGTGLPGLAGMSPSRPLAAGIDLVRPLLGMARAEVLRYLADCDQPFREDPTNRDHRFTRNRLRHELLPLLREQYNPAVNDILCRLAEQAREVQSDVDRQAAALLLSAELPRAGDVVIFCVADLAAAASHVARTAFRLIWQREGWPQGDMTYAHWQRLVGLAHGSADGGDFPGLVHAERHGLVMRLERGNRSAPLHSRKE